MVTSKRGVLAMFRQRLQDHFPALCRLYAGGDAIMSWYNSINDPLSHLYKIAHTSSGGSLLMWVLAIAGAALVLDVLMNDWTPEFIRIGHRHFHLAWKNAFEYRHLLFVTMAFCYAAQPFIAEMSGYGVSLLLFFYWNTLQNLGIAFFDAKLRSRSLRWQRACS